MKKIELIKKYIKVNEIGKAQDLIFRSINDSDIDIQGRTELIDLFENDSLNLQSECITFDFRFIRMCSENFILYYSTDWKRFENLF